MAVFFILFTLALALPVIWPGIDLWASGLFYRAGDGFFLASHPVFVILHGLAVYGSRALAVGLVILIVVCSLAEYAARKQPMPSPGFEATPINAKAWLFLLLALATGPGLVANAGFKDHWGRARPHQVAQFGGSENFSPALIPQPHARPNGSFVCGDGAFGFFLPAFGFAVPWRLSRRAFWAGMGGGALFSFTRLAMGAHFLSDIIYAAFFMLATISALHAVMYGGRETAARWRGFFTSRNSDRPASG